MIQDDPSAAIVAALRAAAEAVAELPRAIEARLLEERGQLPVEVVHGADQQWAAWSRYAADIRPVAPISLYPTLEVVRAHIAPVVREAAEPYRSTQAEHGAFAPRALVGADAMTTPDDHRAVEQLLAAGVDVRISSRVPSWLYADAGVLAALPLIWGEHPPSSIVIIREPAVSTALAALVEPLWRGAEPYRYLLPEWEDTLRLAALGLTDQAIAATQGVSVRTVQRRFAEAMARFDVHSRFELGMAWSATRD
ncbi:helix-turn-helix transcriptional regulator [Microbacterium sp.]|uniref:helix-turn-helix transcriptional regulator n=1 Tax=Microbacterium sp. TaxID=51671 RepID=UPI0039E49590